MNGPLLIFDKSALQGLRIDESVWLDTFFESVITPTFYVETLADLEKIMEKEERTAEKEVELIAARTPEYQATACVHHRSILASELAGWFKLDEQQAKRILGHGQPIMLGDCKGLTYGDAPEEEALKRWQKGKFLEVERVFAKQWRAALDDVDNELLYAGFKRIYERKPRPKNLISVKALVDDVLANAPQDALLVFACTMLGASNELKAAVWQRWELKDKPPMSNFLPYFMHVITIDLFFYMSIAADLISRNRASHRADIAYLYYLPFCSIFTSTDKLHKAIAPLFLKFNQIFLSGEDLKSEMKKLDEHYSNLPQQVRDSGTMKFAKYPPSDTEFLTTRLWDRFVPGWRDLASEPIGTDEDVDAALLEIISKFGTDSVSLDPSIHIPLEDVQCLRIEKQVSTTRGKWKRIPLQESVHV